MDGSARLVPALAGATRLAALPLLAAALLAHLHPRSPGRTGARRPPSPDAMLAGAVGRRR